MAASASTTARPARTGSSRRWAGTSPWWRAGCGSSGARVIRFGPAGWDYKDWAGIVYPRPAPRGFDPLAHLARYFDTVEINSTHYRPMPASVAQDWCERVE